MFEDEDFPPNKESLIMDWDDPSVKQLVDYWSKIVW